MRTSLLDVKDLLRRKHSYLQSSLLPCSIIYRRGNHSPATVNVWHVASVKRSCSTQSHLQPTWANAVRVLQTQGAPPFIGPRSPRLCWGAPSCCFIHRACKKDPKSLFIIESSLLHHEDILSRGKRMIIFKLSNSKRNYSLAPQFSTYMLWVQ